MEQVNVAAPVAPAPEAPAPAPKKKMKLWVLIVAIVGGLALIGGIIAAVLLLTPPAELDMTQYVTITAAGYDGYGTLTVTVDYVKLAEDLGFKEMKDIKEFKELDDEDEVSFFDLKENKKEIEREYDLELDELADLAKAITVTDDIYDNGYIHNDDEYTVKVKVSKKAEFKKTLVGGKIKYTVSALKELTTPEYTINCTFTGANGEGYAKPTLTFEDEDLADLLENYVDEMYNSTDGDLYNGDSYLVRFSISSYSYCAQEARKLGYELPDTFEKEVIVSGLSRHMTYDDMNAATVQKIIDYVAENGDVLARDYEVLAVYYVDGYSDKIIVAFTYPDEETGNVWQHIRGMKEGLIDADGNVGFSTDIDYIFSGSNYPEEDLKQWCTDYYGNYSYTYYDITP